MTETQDRAYGLYLNGSFRESDKLYCEILDKNPKDSRAWHMRGYIAVQLKELERAVEYISRAIELKPNVYSMHINLGSTLALLGHFDQAEAVQKKAIEINPRGTEAYFALGNCLRAKGQYYEAEAAYLEALQIKPDSVESLEMLARNAEDMRDHDKALDYALRAIEQNSDHKDCHTMAGNNYIRRRDYDLALTHYSAALKIDPKDATANSNLGLLFTRTAEYERSVAAYKRALSLSQDDPKARHGLSLALLILGRLSEGWKHYSARLELPAHRLGARPMSSPRILGKPHGLRTLAWADEGIGEQIMFASLIPEITKDCASLSLECDERLTPLMRRTFPNLDLISRRSPPHPKFHANYDGQFCLSNAAEWYRPNFDSFAHQKGYLSADAKLTRDLRHRYQKSRPSKPLIGISWRSKDQIKISSEKSLALKNWGPLLCVPGATFVNLQYGNYIKEISEVETSHSVSIISDNEIDPLYNLDAFASQVAAMDLIITTSNATAHMAGALNVPVWTLVPKGFGAMWHWFLDRNDSPWYPSMSLIRQVQQNDWGPVIDQASSMLVDFVAQWRPATTK